ncbi:hypothetical protein JCM3770_003634 [Rhodotorula araucariae]
MVHAAPTASPDYTFPDRYTEPSQNTFGPQTPYHAGAPATAAAPAWQPCANPSPVVLQGLHPVLEARLSARMSEMLAPLHQMLSHHVQDYHQHQAETAAQLAWLTGKAEFTNGMFGDLLIVLAKMKIVYMSERIPFDADERPAPAPAFAAAKEVEPSMPPLVDDQGTRYYGNGAVHAAAAVAAATAPTNAHGIHYVYGDLPPRLEGTEMFTQATQAPLANLQTAHSHVLADPFAHTLAGGPAANAAPLGALEQPRLASAPWVACAPWVASKPWVTDEDEDDDEDDEDDDDEADDEDDEDFESENECHQTEGEEHAPQPSRAGSELGSELDMEEVAQAAELRVRRLEVKLLRAQLLLAKKKLEQLTGGADDDLEVMDEAEDEA